MKVINYNVRYIGKPARQMAWYGYQRNFSLLLGLLSALAAITFFLVSFLLPGNWAWRTNLLSSSIQA